MKTSLSQQSGLPVLALDSTFQVVHVTSQA